METITLHKGDKWFLTTTQRLCGSDLLTCEILALYRNYLSHRDFSHCFLRKSAIILCYVSSSLDKPEPISIQIIHCDLTFTVVLYKKRGSAVICSPLKAKMAPTCCTSTCRGTSTWQQLSLSRLLLQITAKYLQNLVAMVTTPLQFTGQGSGWKCRENGARSSPEK